MLHHCPFWAPSTKNRWWARPPRSLRSLFGSFRGRKKKKAGGRGRAGKQSCFFLLRAGIFFYFFFKVGWSPSLFLGGEHYFKLFGRLWVSPGHSVLTKVRPFWRGSEQSPAPAASSPNGGLPTQAGPQPAGDTNQPPAVIFAVFCLPGTISPSLQHPQAPEHPRGEARPCHPAPASPYCLH